MRRKSGCAVLGALLTWGSLASAQGEEAASSGADESGETPESALGDSDENASVSLEASGSGVDATADSSTDSEPEKTLLSDRIGIDVGLRVGWAVPFGSIAKVGQTEKRDDDILAAQSVFVTNQAMRLAYDGQLPLQLDLGFRITENIVVGAYGSWGKVFMSSSESPFNCADQPVAQASSATADPMAMDAAAAPGAIKEYDCSASSLRAGIQLTYHGHPNETVDPWASVGSGYEWMSIDNSTTNQSLSFSGFEFVNIGVGLDLEILEALRLGPYFQFSVGGYRSISSKQDLFVYGNYRTYEPICPGPECAAVLPDENVQLTAIHYWATGGLRLSAVF